MRQVAGLRTLLRTLLLQRLLGTLESRFNLQSPHCKGACKWYPQKRTAQETRLVLPMKRSGSGTVAAKRTPANFLTPGLRLLKRKEAYLLPFLS